MAGRLVVVDEGGEYVHLDMYENDDRRTRITVRRDVLRYYAEKLLVAANRRVEDA